MTERIAIVGSRTYPDKNKIGDYMAKLPKDTVIISGGARGVDTYAIFFAGLYGLPKPIIHLPDLSDCQRQHEYTEAYYSRNQKIVDDADRLVAFTEKETGGTWDTVRRARAKGIPIEIIR